MSKWKLVMTRRSNIKIPVPDALIRFVVTHRRNFVKLTKREGNVCFRGVTAMSEVIRTPSMAHLFKFRKKKELQMSHKKCLT